MYSYNLYGMNMISDCEIIGAWKSEPVTMPDVTMKEGNLAKEIQEAELFFNQHGTVNEEGERAWSIYRVAMDESVFFIPKAGMFVLRKGKEIVYKRTDEVDEIHFGQMVLNLCMGTLMIQRQQIAIHGSGVERNGKMCIISGESGSGKSTLTNALLEEGYSFMADDAVALNLARDKVYGCASYPIRRLCADAITEKQREQLDLVYMPDGEREKYGIDMSGVFRDTQTELTHIFIVSPTDAAEVSLRRATGIEKIRAIYSNLYKKDYYRNIEIPPKIMNDCLSVVQNVEIYMIERPRNGMTVAEQAKLVGSVFCSESP